MDYQDDPITRLKAAMVKQGRALAELDYTLAKYQQMLAEQQAELAKMTAGWDMGDNAPQDPEQAGWDEMYE